MLETALIQPGVDASEQMESMLAGDLHAIIWRHDPHDPGGADLRDYVLGAARSVRSNLHSALVQLESYREARYKSDNALILWISSQGSASQSTNYMPAGQHIEELSTRLNAHQQALFTALGAALDCTAAVCVAVSGLRMNVRRADMPALLPTSDDANFPTEGRSDSLKKAMRPAPEHLAELQHQILRGISGSYMAAGPSGWLRWMLDARNTAVHREQSTNYIFFEGDKRTGWTIHRKLHRHPQMSNLQSVRSSDSPAAMLLEEDALVTMEECIRATSFLVQGVGAVVEAEWAKRRIALDIRVPISVQWDKAKPSAFDGFKPGSAKFEPKPGTVLVMNPRDGARLAAGGVLDSPGES
ncbi:hypothetical protein [Curtobacterium sp. VKM Ac-2852]|uniref:hypothetical protein n=1 Tax=Curtobacterium sp. VKM Ac-2852 TaxID=2739024 RepID=UPI00156430B6|nr:hypothetical protein [Curtobacterium sp. VKM Ac-2852]NQX25685.1 hypothetical protein [Curtobacterium sp. VKM Ac-2852]